MRGSGEESAGRRQRGEESNSRKKEEKRTKLGRKEWHQLLVLLETPQPNKCTATGSSPFCRVLQFSLDPRFANPFPLLASPWVERSLVSLFPGSPCLSSHRSGYRRLAILSSCRHAAPHYFSQTFTTLRWIPRITLPSTSRNYGTTSSVSLMAEQQISSPAPWSPAPYVQLPNPPSFMI